MHILHRCPVQFLVVNLRISKLFARTCASQGSAADIQKKAMLAVDEGLRKKNLDARILMSVHDELLLEVWQSAEDKETMKAAKLVLKDGMMNASGTAMPDVKLPVTVLFGLSWKEILDKKARAAVSK